MFGLSPRALEQWQTLSALCDPRQLQRQLLADLRNLAGDYVRSPAFLALMRWQLKAMTSTPQLLPPFRSR